jgi:hypothetical protein
MKARYEKNTYINYIIRVFANPSQSIPKTGVLVYAYCIMVCESYLTSQGQVIT